MTAIQQKEELIQWIESLNNPKIIESLFYYKEKSSLDFNERIKSAFTLDEFKTEITNRIKNYPKKV